MKPTYPLMLLLSFLAGPFPVLAQGTGLEVDSMRIRSVPLAYVPERPALPARVNLKPFCPTPGDQGALPACVGWAIAHARMIMLAREKDPQRLSASFVYNLLTADSAFCTKTDLVRGLELLASRGICPEEAFESSRLFCKPVPGPELMHHARAYRIDTFENAFPYGAGRDTLVRSMQYWLSRRSPILAGMLVSQAFKEYQGGPCHGIDQGPFEWHAVVVVGYRDEGNGRGYFLIMNSYGAHWGEEGFIKLSFEETAKLVKFGFVLRG